MVVEAFALTVMVDVYYENFRMSMRQQVLREMANTSTSFNH